MAFAREVAQGNEEAWEVVNEQAARIANLEAEVTQLQARLAECGSVEDQPVEPVAKLMPKASRRKTSEATREAILADLTAALSQSQAAVRNGVLALTVSRLVRSA